MSGVKIPQNNYLNNRNNPRSQTENAIAHFRELLDDKTHPDNHTEGYRNNVIAILNNLLVAANDLDKLNPGEGIFSLIILSLRSSLKLRDRCNELEVKNRDLKIEIKKLKRQA